MTPNYVLALADPAAILTTVGGKGASLARLAAAGLPVPDGFHVTTAAYWCFVDENDLQPRILAALQATDPARPVTLEAASSAITSLFAASPIPADLAEAIQAAYASPMGGRVPATLVVPDGAGPFAGMLFQHGSPSTRQPLIAAAVIYARLGAVVLLIDAPFARRAGGLNMPFTLTEQDRREQIQLIVDLRLPCRAAVPKRHAGSIFHSR